MSPTPPRPPRPTLLSVSEPGPAAPHLGCIDGLRALSILWMMGFHVLFMAGYWLQPDQYMRLSSHPAVALFAKGHLGVEIFFVLSGYLIARLLLHVLPPGFKRIRHYGLLAAAVKSERLAQARALLRMPQPNAQAMEDAQAFMRRVAALHIERCAHCASGRWQVVGQCPADRLALARVPPLACRGPP